MFTPEFGLVIIAFLGNIFLGLFTYFKNPKSATNRLFFFFTVAIALYIYTNFLVPNQTTDSATLFWIRTVMIVAQLINIIFYLFATAFPSNKLHINKLFFGTIILFTLGLIPSTYTAFIFKSVEHGSIQPIPGIGMGLFLLHTILLLGGGFFVIFKKYRSSSGIEKVQIRLLFGGTILMFFAILLTNLIFVIVFNTTELVGLLPIYALFFVATISYAIIRHRFLDISLIVARTVSYAVLTTVLILMYAVLLYTVSNLFYGESVSQGRILTSSMLALVLVYTFQPIRTVLEKVTNNIFYKEHYDSQVLISELTRIMASTFALDELTHRILKALLKEVRINRGLILLLNKNHISYQYQTGYDLSKIPVITYKEAIKLIGKEHARGLLVFDELPRGKTKNLLRDKGFSITLPLVTKSGHIGLLALGNKSSGDIYSDQDIQLLKILAPELSIAIQNAQAFDEIKRFNVTLRNEVQKATTDLRNANDRLKQLDKLKDEFLSIAGHELRTPMTAIKSYVWMILNKRQKGDKLSAKTNRYLDRTYKSTERLINLVNDMLDVSRIESGRIELKPEPINPKDIALEIAEEVSSRSLETKVSVTIKNRNIPKVLADKNKTHQILLNLIGNSLKFTPPQGSIVVDFKKTGKFIEISVADTGKGIAKEDQPRLFTKFGRLEGSYTAIAAVKGTGLGLYLCKQYVEKMSGKISLESEFGKGTTVSFTLPIA